MNCLLLYQTAATAYAREPLHVVCVSLLSAQCACVRVCVHACAHCAVVYVHMCVSDVHNTVTVFQVGVLTP